MRHPTLSIHRVSPGGAVSLVAANVSYSSLQWTRRFSACGQFEAVLSVGIPFPWPGRFIATLSDHSQVAVIEKADVAEGAGGGEPKISGRFAESLFDRYKMGQGGESVRGANWRQAVTAAMRSWHMNDIPPLSLGAGTEEQTGSSYVLSEDAGKSAMEAIFACASSNGSYPEIAYDRSAYPNGFELRLIDGKDRTRAQKDRPWWVFSLMLGSASSVTYSGDYSVGCSEVVAHAEKDVDGTTVSVTQTVAVPGFDPETQWAQRAYEDVGSLIGQDAVPTASLVTQAGLLRAYDHTPALAIDCDAVSDSYLTGWDVGDLVEVELAELSLVAVERIEEAREIYDGDGPRVEATVGTKTISKLARAVGRR